MLCRCCVTTSHLRSFTCRSPNLFNTNTIKTNDYCRSVQSTVRRRPNKNKYSTYTENTDDTTRTFYHRRRALTISSRNAQRKGKMNFNQKRRVIWCKSSVLVEPRSLNHVSIIRKIQVSKKKIKFYSFFAGNCSCMIKLAQE